MSGDKVQYYEHLAYVHPLAINQSAGIVTQFEPDGSIERQLTLSERGTALLIAFLDAPGHYLSRDEAMAALEASLTTVKSTLRALNNLLASFNLEFAAVAGTGYVLMAKHKREGQ